MSQQYYYDPNTNAYYQPRADVWVCTNCKRTNLNSLNSCPCGTLKPGRNPSAYANGWVCPNCRKSNPMYTGTCACGQKKAVTPRRENTFAKDRAAYSAGQRVVSNTATVQTAAPASVTPAAATNTSAESELERIQKIKGYKELLDMGAISQEEFDAKKKQLLGL